MADWQSGGEGWCYGQELQESGPILGLEEEDGEEGEECGEEEYWEEEEVKEGRYSGGCNSGAQTGIYLGLLYMYV